MAGADVTLVTPAPLDSMSLQLVIPWRVALQQSPLPLHQPAATLQQWRGGSQLPIRRYTKTTLTRGLTLGAHPTELKGISEHREPREAEGSARSNDRFSKDGHGGD